MKLNFAYRLDIVELLKYKTGGSVRLMSYMSSSLVFQSKELQTEPL
jgi:hypothetical protein